MSKTLHTIARHVAVEAKASGIGVKDLGCFYDHDWNLTDAEWEQVCDEATELFPTVVVPAEVSRQWARVNADHRAEQVSELRFCGQL